MGETDRDDLISILEDGENTETVPTTLPLMPVRDVVIFTDMLLPLFVGREKSIRAVEAAVAADGYVMLATQKDPANEDPTPEEIFEVGTVGRVLRMIKMPDGRAKALVQGVGKARILRYLRRRNSFRVRIEIIEEPRVEEPSLETQAMMRNVREHAAKMLTLRGEMTTDIASILDSIEEPGKLADLVATNLKLKIEESQGLLEIMDPVARLEQVNSFLARELALSSVQAKIQSNVRDEISKGQRDYFLREQMRAIHRELGESDDRLQEIEDYRAKIKKAKMPPEAAEEAGRQLRRLELMHAESAEAAVVRNYLDWLVELPWNRATRDMIDIAAAKKILDQDHYGLEKVKDRILEYLSVRKLNPASKGPILCFVGPPGVGKTSLGRSIARAMKRRFVRISLGGIRDEAEIRGHRRTYIGALPGRIIQGLKQAGKANPVFMMDEIDKLGADFRGDPSAALLEALDPEQNHAFSDHYLNLPFDLSKVMFILTANMLDTIPSALLDRMEVIQISGYTVEEKRKIARQYLLPRQYKENGLKPRQMTISDGALDQIIEEYTMEAGLRNLERELGALCRKVARRRAEGDKRAVAVTRANLGQFLGVPRFYPELDQEESQVGLSTGLAWTQAGGEVLYVEATLLGGKGELLVTGQIGEVMQESARAALSYARANLPALGVKASYLDNLDVHLHVPAGAIPKDGPSAGVAMATALISALTRRPVRKDVAMTGEITLRGRVLPIGGLKEKALGALRAGIRTILMPEKNRRELDELPASLKRKIKFVPVRQMDAVLEAALLPPEPAPRSRKTTTRSSRTPAAKPKAGRRSAT
jgi:ATP-dependent Lon protease